MGLSLYTSLSDIKPSDIYIGLFSIITLYVIRFYYKHFTRVNPLPGPIPIPLIGSVAIFKEDIDDWFNELNKVYGKEGIYEVNIAGNRQIVITRAEHIDKFLVSSVHSGHLMRTANNGLLDLFDLETKGVGLNHSFNYWKFNNMMFSQGVMPLSYTTKPSKYANALFEEMSGYWMDLKPKDDESAVLDIATWMRRFTCDFISLLTTEKQSSTIRYYYRKLRNETPTKEMIESEEFIESINTFVSDNQIMFVPKSIKDLPFIKSRVGKLLTSNYKFYGRLKEIIVKRRKELEKSLNGDTEFLKSKQLDLLTSLIVVNTPYDTRPPKNVHPSLLRPMTDDEIRGVMFDAFVAGTDTTVNTFSFVIYYISHHPEVKKKLFEEIDSVFKDDPTREVTTTDLEKLKYCEAIIKETSRVRPTVSMLSRYSDKPDEIAGYKWPSKTLFIMYVRAINNNPLYWKDPEKFIPERFYDPEQIASQHKNSFLMFGGGPRMCLGRKVAMIELKTLLTLVYRKYDVELVNKDAPLKIITSTITICKDLDVKITPRKLTTSA